MEKTVRTWINVIHFYDFVNLYLMFLTLMLDQYSTAQRSTHENVDAEDSQTDSADSVV